MLSVSVFAQNGIIGFKEANVKSQNKLEEAFDAQLSAKNLDEWMQLLSARPHYVGTAYGLQNAEWMVKQFKSWGFDAKIETYHVLFPYPKIRLLELTEPATYKAKLSAIPIAEDKYTQQTDELLPSYNAFSADGDVEAELVFVNYGIPADYEELERLGIDVKGKIVIAKYAGSWRGIKPKLAAEKGAIGCIIYSDPKDDGYYSGDTYPDGAFKNETGVQRGSVMDTPFIQHAGIAALNLGYFGENEGGEYHTIYDTYPQYKRFKDPAFEYGIALAKTAGSIVLRLTNSDVLPFEFQQWNSTVSGYMAELVKLTNDMRTTVGKHNTLVEKNVFELAADPTKTFVKPVKKELIPYLDFTPLQNELVALNKVITDFAAQDFSQLDQAQSDKLNEKLLLTERALMNETGLPRRPWYKHQIYAPGFYTGYGVKTLPGVREAIEQENWEEATEQIKVLTNTLSGFKNHIKELLSIVE
jgi:hypothetical protein